MVLTTCNSSSLHRMLKIHVSMLSCLMVGWSVDEMDIIRCWWGLVNNLCHMVICLYWYGTIVLVISTLSFYTD